MKITSYNNAISSVGEIKAKTEQKNINKNIDDAGELNNAQSDVLDISDRIDISRSAAIQAKIKSGFYNDPGIIRETAARLLRDIDETL